jgi:hypothetical protein
MSDFNIEDYLNSPETKALVRAKREEIMGPKSAPPIVPRREQPPPKGPDDYGASAFDSGSAPGRPSLRVVAGGGVPEPQDLPASLLPVPAFDPDLLPENFKAWVEDIGTRMQCPLDYVAVAAMIGAGVLIGRKIAVRPKQRDNWTEVSNL